jgi:hypothetical protein
VPADYLHTINPDLIIGGHCWVLDQPQQLIERYRTRMHELRAAFQELSAESDYRFMFDPYWVQAAPYRVMIEAGGRAGLQVLLRNFLPEPLKYRVEIHAPAGLSTTPATIELTVEPGATRSVPVELSALADAKPGLHIVAFDVTRGHVRQGELFDFIAWVGPVHDETKPPAPAAKGAY